MFRKIVFVYVALLIASHLFTALYDTGALPAGQRHIDVGDGVRIAYIDSAPSDTEKPVVLLIHGSPVDVALFTPLIAHLSPHFHVIAPVLPGFGASTRKIPDYSIAAHAHYVERFLAKAGLPAAHVVGYSMGAGVAIELTHLRPNLVSSLTLLSGIGAQEHELLGNYHLNHLLHGLQLAFFWSLDHFIPHFGGFETFPLNYYYARNFFDTDQRLLKKYLSDIQSPVLILHGDDDVLVPVAAAHKHHLLVPQSELKIFPGAGHLMLWEKKSLVGDEIRGFLTRVEESRMKSSGFRSTAEKQRREHALTTVQTPHVHGRALIFLLLLIAVATLLSEDLAAVSAGILAANGNISLVEAIVASFAGIFIGDILLLLLGAWLRSGDLVNRVLIKFVSTEALANAERWIDHRGVRAVFVSRFIPGTRLPLYLAIGYSRRGVTRFVAAFCLACLIWTPLIVGGGYFLGEQALAYLDKYNGSVTWVFLGAAAVYLIFQKLILPLTTWKGRRLLYSTWLRLTHWEFWPPVIFYIPLAFYFVYLVIRFRSFTVFTAANPAIPDGGVVGESKAAILQGLAGAGKSIARFVLIDVAPVERRLKFLSDFMRRQKLKFPVVLKPDVGERGNGVEIVRSPSHAKRYLAANAHAVIAQEYVPGLEFGVFYFRFPGSGEGKIFAITDKRFPSLTGDGKSSLESLILTDKRAVAMARFHLQKFAARLNEVIPAGRHFPLVELGTHCKGSLFLEGIDYLTPALARAIDGISRTFEGFYFGRYDIRVPSLADFQRGRNLKIVELNGVTSEATSIYDPKHSLLHAYSRLARQWQIAFEIGARNATRGAIVTSLSVLLRRLFARR